VKAREILTHLLDEGHLEHIGECLCFGELGEYVGEVGMGFQAVGFDAAELAEKSQFFRLMTKGRIAFSAIGYRWGKFHTPPHLVDLRPVYPDQKSHPSGWLYVLALLEAPIGIEPMNGRFAVCGLTTWLRRPVLKIARAATRGSCCWSG
jgi:hypothetical protein